MYIKIYIFLFESNSNKWTKIFIYGYRYVHVHTNTYMYLYRNLSRYIHISLYISILRHWGNEIAGWIVDDSNTKFLKCIWILLILKVWHENFKRTTYFKSFILKCLKIKTWYTWICLKNYPDKEEECVGNRENKIGHELIVSQVGTLGLLCDSLYFPVCLQFSIIKYFFKSQQVQICKKKHPGRENIVKQG